MMLEFTKNPGKLTILSGNIVAVETRRVLNIETYKFELKDGASILDIYGHFYSVEDSYQSVVDRWKSAQKYSRDITKDVANGKNPNTNNNA